MAKSKKRKSEEEVLEAIKRFTEIEQEPPTLLKIAEACGMTEFEAGTILETLKANGKVKTV